MSPASYPSSNNLAATPDVTHWGVTVSGQEISFIPAFGPLPPYISADTCVKLTIGNSASGFTEIENPPTAGDYIIEINIPNGGDPMTGDIAVAIVNDDQVVVTASIPEIITFSISDNTIGFGTLSASASRYATGDGNGSGTETEAHNLTVGTNAANGYTMTINGDTLTNILGPDTYTIDAIGGTNTAPSVGTEQFGVRFEPTGGLGQVAEPYADTGFAYDINNFEDEAAFSYFASDTTTYSARYLANIGAATEAGAYSATLTYLATANF